MAKKKDAEKAAQNDENIKQEKSEGTEDEEPNFSDPEDYVDNITDEG